MQTDMPRGDAVSVIGEGNGLDRAVGRLEIWLQNYLTELLDMTVNELDTRATFSRLGLDSASAIAMTGELAQWLRCEIDPMAAYEFPTIASLSRTLAARADVQAVLNSSRA